MMTNKRHCRKQRGIFAGYFSYYIAAGGEYNPKVIKEETARQGAFYAPSSECMNDKTPR